MSEERIREGLTFDDVLLVPGASEVLPDQVDVRTQLTKEIALNIPLAMSSFPADGGIVATLADSLRFLRGFFGGELLAEDELSYLTGRWNRIFFPMQYGGGVMRFHLPRWLAPIKNPGELMGHSGSTGSFAFYSRQREIFLVGTVNQSDRPGRPFGLMSSIVDLVG